MEEAPKQYHRSKRVRREKQEDVVEKGNDSDGIPVEDLPGYFYANLREIRKDVQCPICLGIIKKTRTVMECLHSFCKECIDKAMRLGNNECPACRTHCASRRSLRDNPNLDNIIGFFFPDIEKFEKEEAAINEEEEKRNKQIQESIARIHELQSQAVNKKHPTTRDTANALAVQSPSTGGLTWGRGGARSKPGDSGAPSTSRDTGTRISNLSVHLNFSNESDEFDVHVFLIPLENTPSLQQPQLSCRSSFTVNYVRQHVAREASLRSEDVEILLAEESIDLNNEPPVVADDTSAAVCDDLDSLSAGRSNLWLRRLDGEQTLHELINSTDANSQNLILAYRRKGNQTANWRF